MSITLDFATLQSKKPKGCSNQLDSQPHFGHLIKGLFGNLNMKRFTAREILLILSDVAILFSVLNVLQTDI